MTASQQREGLIWTRNPVADLLIPPLSFDQQTQWLLRPDGAAQLEDYWHQHERLITDASDDPFHHGFELPFWQDLWQMIEEKDEVYALGGNGPGKTEIGSKMCVRALTRKPKQNVLAISKNEDVSKQLQQRGVYKYLPKIYREYNEKQGARKREAVSKIKYTQAGGFTEGTFVLPNGSQMWFKTVEQYERNNDVFEGPEYDFIWVDEPSPLGMVSALSYRVGKRGGKFFFSFTAVNGYDAVCSSILEGAKCLKTLPMDFQWHIKSEPGQPEGSRDSKLIIPELKLNEVQIKGLPAGHMPYIMQPLNPQQGIIFLWTHWNLFLERSKLNPHLPAYFDKCLRKSKQTVRMRLYGWTEKLAGSQFPNFNTSVHILPHDKIEEMLKPRDGSQAKLTAYQSADPATARSYFCLWAGVDELGRKFIYDESPRMEEGEWVGEDGGKGDGQSIYAGMGVKFYKGYFRLREREHGAEPLRRFGDPRAFATEAASAEGGTDLFALFEEEGPDDQPELDPMFFEPAKVMRSLLAEADTGSLDKINDALAYNTDLPISVDNEPHLYISGRCQNLIKAILNWSPEQGAKSPWKDPIDCFRYLFGEELYYLDPDMPEVIRGGARRQKH